MASLFASVPAPSSASAPALSSSGSDLRGRCRPSCCKTPHGHSAVRDSFPEGHREACTCHLRERA